jgi:agmatinase
MLETKQARSIPMVPGRKASLPRVYGDTPTFLGVPKLEPGAAPDVAVVGVPWEGTVTWGSFSGCELAPRTIRHASARYGGFLPEYELDLFDYLQLADAGDIAVDPNSPQETMQRVYATMDRIYRGGSIPVSLGGDHSFTPAVVRALAHNRDGAIGVVHFDAHLDNAPEFGDDPMPRCSPLYHVAHIPQVRTRSIVQIGIRGPRNSPAQLQCARDMGATVFTIRDIRRRGMDPIVEDAIRIAREGTESVYVTICSDCIDAAFNPGGPADFNGLFPHELFGALFQLGEAGFDGIDFVEVYPPQDPTSFSSHLASWALIHGLAGLAARKRSGADLH